MSGGSRRGRTRGRLRVWGILAAWLAVAAAPAGATPVTYAFQGVVSVDLAEGGLFGPPLATAVGSAFTGHFSYDTGPGNPDQMPGDPEVGAYDALSLVIDQAVVPITVLGVGVLHEAPIPTLPPLPPDTGTDAFLVAASAPGYSIVRLRLEAPHGTVFSSDSLPVNLDLASFTSATLRGLVTTGLNQPSTEDVGTLQSLVLVPEPTAGLLLALAAASALAASRGAHGGTVRSDAR